MTTTWQPTGTVLDRIIERTAAALPERRERTPVSELERRIADRPAPRSLRDALRQPGVSVIAEFKRGSPSRGRFPVEMAVAEVVQAYIDGGAAALSVLTDGPFFFGSLTDMSLAADISAASSHPVPVLRKDFIIDPYQLYEARAFGADAVLLIVAALDDVRLQDLHATATGLDLDALVEVHDGAEMERAINLGAAIIGINNRDLRDFHVDLETTVRLAPRAPAGTVLVGESGIFTHDDVRRLEDAGVHAVLVGEGLIVQPDRGDAVRRLRGDDSHHA